LLNEFLKEHEKLQQQERTVQMRQEFAARMSEQQKQIDGLDGAAQIAGTQAVGGSAGCQPALAGSLPASC
jgi:hypothetical protein